MIQTDTEQNHFISYLEWLLEQEDRSAARAAMAHLRHGLGKQAGLAPEMDKYVLTRLPKNASHKEEAAHYLIASLFAYWHQGKDKAESAGGNLGTSLRNLVEREALSETTRDNVEKSIEKKLTALLNSNRDDLPKHLQRIVGLLKSKDIPINWGQLLLDVQFWDQDNRIVQHKWSKGFWIH